MGKKSKSAIRIRIDYEGVLSEKTKRDIEQSRNLI